MNTKDFTIVILIIICVCLLVNTESFSLISRSYDKSKDIARGVTSGAKNVVKTVTFDIPQKVGSVTASIPGRTQRAMATGFYGASNLVDSGKSKVFGVGGSVSDGISGVYTGVTSGIGDGARSLLDDRIQDKVTGIYTPIDNVITSGGKFVKNKVSTVASLPFRIASGALDLSGDISTDASRFTDNSLLPFAAAVGDAHEYVYDKSRNAIYKVDDVALKPARKYVDDIITPGAKYLDDNIQYVYDETVKGAEEKLNWWDEFLTGEDSDSEDEYTGSGGGGGTGGEF